MQHEQTPTRNLQFNYQDYEKRNKNLQKSKIDKYYIFENLGGTGQFGTVYRGMDGLTKKQVALKILDKRTVEQLPPSNKKRLKKRLIEDESEIMKKVNSQNVLKLYECLQNRDLKIMIIQYCNNGSLFDLLSERGRLPEDEAITLLKQVINGVAECHKMNIVHRDLKLQNILIHNGECKIADFGFSKVLKIQNESETVKNTILGSLLTMAPQVMFKEKYGLKADIWSLGVIFFQLIFGRNPFKFDGNNLHKCFKEGVQLINSQQECYSVRPSVEARKFIRQVLVIDQQKRLGWRDILNHQLFKLERPILPTRFYRTVNLKIKDSLLEQKEKEICKSSISNLNQSQQISIQSLPKPNQQPQSVPKSHQVRKNQQQTSHIQFNLTKLIDPLLKQPTHQSKTQKKPQEIKNIQAHQNIQSQKTQNKLKNQKDSLQKNQQPKIQNKSTQQQAKTQLKQQLQKSLSQQKNKNTLNLIKSSQVLNNNKDPIQQNNNKIQKKNKKCQSNEPKKQQVKSSKQKAVKVQNHINKNELQHKVQNKKNDLQNMIDRYSLTDQQLKKAHEAINREDEQIYKWAQRIHNQCLRAEFIYHNIVKVIERHNLLDLNDREVIELMYLICTRCRNNISPIYNEYAKRKNNKIIQDLKNLVEPLYRIINGKYNAYSNQLTKKQNGLISIAKDFFPKRFSSDFKRKDHFLTAVQSMEQFKPVNAPQKKTVKVGDKFIKEKDLVDYTKEEQIQFTDECMQKIIPKLKFIESNKELRMTMKNFKKICLMKAEGLKPQIFRQKLKQTSQLQ